AEDGIRDGHVTGVQTCALPISSGTRSAHRPRLPPAMDGEADSRSACLPLNGCGRNRDTQSIRFFSSPGIDPLYSGEAMTNPSFEIGRASCRERVEVAEAVARVT